ncbi:hypothetical protein IF1G_08015 [Cordyceps javanica]|uniref:Uncharacterized protein n=1 Tax=Cordyceps javanica TaxID=43265 RepID=A0A545UVE8_9HYPO|nr:hypothetical protein IF1G_08015 [Cordyceps javanica]
MFRWYCNVTRRYMYMEDVSRADKSDEEGKDLCRSSFQASRWLTRGWTCGLSRRQRISLETMIRDIAGLPAKALRGTSLSEFTVSERESSARNRQTKYGLKNDYEKK